MNYFTKKFSKLKENKGFTLVELMVVIVIIAILAAIALPSFTKVIDDAKDSNAVSEARSLYTTTVTAHNRYWLVRSGDKPTWTSIIKDAGQTDLFDLAPSEITSNVWINIPDKDNSLDDGCEIYIALKSDSGNWIFAVNGNTEIINEENFIAARALSDASTLKSSTILLGDGWN